MQQLACHSASGLQFDSFQDFPIVSIDAFFVKDNSVQENRPMKMAFAVALAPGS
jgi:hypothetical protein